MPSLLVTAQGDISGPMATDDPEEKEIAVNMISTLVTKMKQHIQPYAEQLSQLLTELLKEENDSIKRSAAVCSAELVVQMGAQKGAAVKYFLDQILTTAKMEYDVDTLESLLHSVQSIIENSEASLSDTEVPIVGEALVKFILESKNRRQQVLNAKGDEEDEDDAEDLELLMQEEDSFNITLSDVIGALYKHYPAHSINVACVVYEKIICQGFEGELWEIKLSLYLCDDIADHIGLDGLPQILTEKICMEFLK